MRILPLTSRTAAGLFTLVDDDDFERLAGAPWRYERETIPRNRRRKTPIQPTGFITGPLPRLHRGILVAHGADLTGLVVRHKNGWPFDNRKANLISLPRANNALSGRRKNVHCVGDGWHVAVGQTDLGHYPTKEAAMTAYDEFATPFGYVSDSQRKLLLGDLVSILDGLVADGILVYHPTQPELEDRYRRPLDALV